MANARANIFKVGVAPNPVVWNWTFDRTDVNDGAIDSAATATNPTNALDAIKPLIQAMPGSLSKVILTIESFEP